MPASVLILMEAASAAVTVCFTDCIKFCAFPTSISVASMSSSVPGIKNELFYKETSHPVLRAWLPSQLRGFSAGSRWWGCAHTLGAGSEEFVVSNENSKVLLTVLILLSVHSLASSLASLVTSSEDSAMALAMEISSLLLPLSS